MKGFDKRLNASWWVLKISLGVAFLSTGIDKYFDKLTDWGMYLSPLATKVFPVSQTTFMHIGGVVEIVLALIVLTRWTKIGAYLLILWLIGIIINLFSTGMFYDLAMRDIEIAISALVLALLTAVRDDKAAEAKQEAAVPDAATASVP